MRGSRSLLSPEDLDRRAAQLQNWKVAGRKKLVRSYTFPDFKTALDFVNRVGAVAEKQGHHPDIHLTWGRVEIETWTHDSGGITEQDYLLASGIDQLS